MNVKLLIPPSGKKIYVLIFAAVFLLAPFLTVVMAQSRIKRHPSRLPRVAELKYEDTANENVKGETTVSGCDNHIIGWKSLSERAIFTSNADGSNAQMNLNGRNVSLKLVKTTLYYNFNKYGNVFAYHMYRAGATSITASYFQLTDYISDYPAKIVLQKGQLRRTIRAVGAAQCD